MDYFDGFMLSETMTHNHVLQTKGVKFIVTFAVGYEHFTATVLIDDMDEYM